MKKVYLIHGFEGKPNGGWRPYIMRELGQKDIYACALAMPNPENPILPEWISEIKRHINQGDNDEIYLIGHSLGGPAIMKYLEQNDSSEIKGIILISSPCFYRDGYEKISEFLKDGFDWSVIKNKVNNIVIVHGDNDPLVPLSDAEEISNKLQKELIIIKNGQHLNGSAGFFEFPELLKVLLEMVK